MSNEVVEDETLFKDGFLTVPQVAKYLSIGKTLVYSLMDRGELKYCKFGKARRIPKKEVVQFAKDRMTKPDAENTTLPE